MTDQADIVERLVDLHKQATTERSHYYVASCCREAIAEITRLREALAQEREECAAIAEDKFGDVEIAAAIRARTP